MSQINWCYKEKDSVQSLKEHSGFLPLFGLGEGFVNDVKTTSDFSVRMQPISSLLGRQNLTECIAFKTLNSVQVQEFILSFNCTTQVFLPAIRGRFKPKCRTLCSPTTHVACVFCTVADFSCKSVLACRLRYKWRIYPIEPALCSAWELSAVLHLLWRIGSSYTNACFSVV